MRASMRRKERPSTLLVVAVGGYMAVLYSSATGVMGDLNNDGNVNIFDMSILLSKWGTADAIADLNSGCTLCKPNGLQWINEAH